MFLSERWPPSKAEWIFYILPAICTDWQGWWLSQLHFNNHFFIFSNIFSNTVTIEFNRKNCIQGKLTLSVCADNSIVSKKKTNYFDSIWNTSQFKRLYRGTINESKITRVWKIHKSNPDQHLVFLAPQVGSMSQVNKLGERVGSTIWVHELDDPESNSEQLLHFKAP